jgi:hypothetical protein
MGSSHSPLAGVPGKGFFMSPVPKPEGVRERANPHKVSALHAPGDRWRMLLPGKLRKKMLINNERTQYVYENKRKMDKVPDPKSDIYVEMTCL